MAFSTEPQARALLEQRRKERARKTGTLRTEERDGTKGQGEVTGTSPPGMQKSKKQGDAERQALRDKQKKRAEQNS